MITIDQYVLLGIFLFSIFSSFWVGRIVGTLKTLTFFERAGYDVDKMIEVAKK
jgi:hypothetical protein